VLLVDGDGDGAPVVVKDFAPRGRWLHPIGRWLHRRELKAYRQLDGHPCVPRLLGSLDGLAFCVEYRPGEILTRSLRGRLPAAFLPELRRALSEMHERGVAHLDLRHRSNVLAGEDGHPVLLDFASAVCFRPGGVAARLLLPWLARLDERAFRKWQVRLGGEA
jgi:RIO-like serine/threonine protein kinase